MPIQRKHRLEPLVKAKVYWWSVVVYINVNVKLNWKREASGLVVPGSASNYLY